MGWPASIITPSECLENVCCRITHLIINTRAQYSALKHFSSLLNSPSSLSRFSNKNAYKSPYYHNANQNRLRRRHPREFYHNDRPRNQDTEGSTESSHIATRDTSDDLASNPHTRLAPPFREIPAGCAKTLRNFEPILSKISSPLALRFATCEP